VYLLIARALFFYQMERKVIFSHGFVKKTQKAPLPEIERAKAIRMTVQGA
jgi:phage-related protein